MSEVSPTRAYNVMPTRAYNVRVNESNAALLLVRGMDAYELGEIEALIWENCDGSQSVDDIAGKIAEAYGVQHDVALSDAGAFIDELRTAGLLESATG